MKKLIITIIAIITILSCCTKEDLQPEDYKFYCKVDGVEWKRTEQNGFCPGCSPLQSDYYPNGSILAAPGKLVIRAHRVIESKGVRQYIYIYIKRLKKVGENIKNVLKRIYIDYEGLCRGKDDYQLDTTHNNKFVVTLLDTIERRIQGTFILRGISYDCTPPDTIMITDGHFDLNPVWHP